MGGVQYNEEDDISAYVTLFDSNNETIRGVCNKDEVLVKYKTVGLQDSVQYCVQRIV
jgi:hypothetical protein